MSGNLRAAYAEIDAEHVCKSFDRRGSGSPAVDDISMKVTSSSAIGIVGESGTGVCSLHLGALSQARRREAVAIAVPVPRTGVVIDGPVAVAVDAICELERSWIDRGIAIVAVACGC